MDNELTKQLQNWVNEDSRDYEQGNILLLKFSGNKIRFRNISANPSKYKDIIEYELKKYLNFRLSEMTHEQFVTLSKEAQQAYDSNFSRSKESKTSENFWKGKRADHDQLPENIQKLYEEIPVLRHEMQRVHTKLESLSDTEMVCPDSDRLPFVKELISLNKQIRSNWNRYDSYDPSNPEVSIEESKSEQSRKALALINLNKGKYANNPAESLKVKLKDAYSKVSNPTEKLTSELKDLGVLD